MKSYPKNLEFREFMEAFRSRYFLQCAEGRLLIAMTSGEALLLSKYLFSGIAEWTPPPVDEAGGPSSLEESLERFAVRNIREIDLELRANEEDLRALGTFLLRGLAAVFLTLERADEQAYCSYTRH